jgi:NAD(P)-dependent dehydrogenase (short-subunit alcohol dehydrogenase family)
LKGKVCVITGAGAGIGKESAMLFAQNGAEALVLADFNETEGWKVRQFPFPATDNYLSLYW